MRRKLRCSIDKFGPAGRMECALEGKKEKMMAEGTQSSKPKSARKPSAKAATTGAAVAEPAAGATPASSDSNHRDEARGRFNAALQEARAGAAALRNDAAERATAYRSQARSQSDAWVADAKAYGEQARGRAGELATEGKGRLAEAIGALSRAVSDTAATVDERLGAKYGDYARTASRSLEDYSTRLDQRSVEELGEDAREFVRKSPGLAVGMAAVGGFLLARLFRGSND
jgi:ElaB/YqjD/DUF883 family membrane-anchored ribosome-binding protein